MLGILFFGVFNALLVPNFFVWPACKGHMRDRHTLLRQIREFSVKEAQCFKEEDRAFVEAQIKAWFGDLETFEGYVHDKVAAQVERLLEDQGPIPYRFIFVGLLPSLFLFASLGFTALDDGHTDLAWTFFLHCVSVMTIEALVA